jgi:hypothetical protein
MLYSWIAKLKPKHNKMLTVSSQPLMIAFSFAEEQWPHVV